MNKTYRTVWNATTGTWAAAPETARMRTKSKSSSAMKSSVSAAVAVMAGVGGGAVSVDAMAQTSGGGLNLCATTTSANGVRYGQTFGALSNTAGANCAPTNTALPSYQGHAPSFILGNNAGTNGGTSGTAPTASVMGSTDGHLVMYGQNGVHISGPADFNNNVNMTNHRITNLANGTAGTDAVTLNQLNAALTAGDDPYVDVRGSVAARANGTNSLAIGNGAVAGGADPTNVSTQVAIGNLANAQGLSSVSIGSSSSADGTGATAIGRASAARAAQATALGNQSTATAANSIALGSGSIADRGNTLSVGTAASQRQIVNVAAGTQGTDAVNLNQLNTAIAATNNPRIVVGGATDATVSGRAGNIAIGSGANSAASAFNSASIALGDGASSTSAGTVAVGSNSNASGWETVALGLRASATGAMSVVVGGDASATADNAVALGTSSVADRANSVSIGSARQQRQIVNVAAGTQDTDAVNVSQLKGSGLIGDDGQSIAAVTYDRHANGTPNYGSVTLGNGTGPTQLKNVADATDDHDALNLGQLKDTGLVGDDGSGNLTSLAVTYDDAAKQSVTLGNAGTPVAIHNVAAGDLSATSTDAVNGSQLFATNTRVGDLEDSLRDGGVIDPVTGESLAVVYDGTAKDKVTLAGADGTTLSNVKAGVADMDAVNVSQLKDSGLIGDDGKAIAAVTYDRNADGTPNYGTVTLGNGTGPTQLKNVAAGVDGTDAVNVNQMNTGLSDLEDRLKGADLRFVKVNADPATGTPALATGALAVAIGSGAQAAGANSLALGSGARVSGMGSVAIGYNSVANQNNVVSVGSVGNERRIVNVADGDVSFQSTDAVNGGQLYAALNDLSTSVSSKTQQAIDSFSSALDEKTKATLNEVNSRASLMDVTDPLVAIEGVRGDNLASLNGADPSTATAAAIGSSTVASGANAVAVGLQSGALSDNSVAIGSFAQTGAGQPYSVAMGSNVQTNGAQAVAMGANAQANADYALAIGNNNVLAIGDSSIALGNGANVRAGATNAIAMGTGANVARNVEGAMALGSGATATTNGGIALGDNALANRANALSIGRAGAERQIVNVAAGTQTTDAVNVGQLTGVTNALGGGAGVGADGSVTQPTYSVAGRDYNNVGDALDAIAASGGDPDAVKYDDATHQAVTLGNAGTPVAIHNVAEGALTATSTDAVNGSQLFATNTRVGDLEDSLRDGGVIDPVTGESLAVVYDGTAKDKVTLAGADGTTLSNVKAGVADMDAVNVSQLKDSGLIGDDGKAIAAVTYDRNADGTPNYGTVTLGNGTGPTQLKNVADATDDGDALNLGQLKNAGLVGDDGAGNLTSAAVTYDRNADGTINRDKVTLAGVDGTTITNVKAGALTATSTDAVNGSQLFATNTRVGDLEDSLRDGGVIDPVTGESLAVVYDGTAKDTVTLKGADGTTLSNVKAGVADMDAVNVSQLKDSGLIGDDGKAIAAVTYDRNADGTPNYGTVTLGHGTGPTQLKNVADATDNGDAVNFGQMKQYVADNPGDGGPGNPLAVAYDDAAKGQVTLAGADGTTMTNVKAGAVTATSTDAINGSQLHGTAQSVADSLGGGSTVDADGKVTSPTYSLADPTDGSTKTEYHNVGDALANLDGRTSTNTENITVINQQLSDSGLVDPATGQALAAVTYDRNADGTPNRGSVTLGGADATAPVALKNVAAGVDRHDAINLGQLQDAGLVAPVDPTNPGAGLTSLAVAYDNVTKDTVTLAGAGGTTLTNVKAGAVSATSTDAINGAQLYGASKSVANALGGGATVDANGNVTNPTYTVNNETFDNVGDALENISSSLVHGSIGLVQQDEDTRDITVAKDTDGTIVNFAGTAGDRVLTGVAAGTVSATSNDAINGSQLHGTAQSVADTIGGGTTVDADGKLTGTSILVNGDRYKTVEEAVQAAATSGATDSMAVRYDNLDHTSVTLGGTGALAPVRLGNVADGVSQYDAVNFGQLSDLRNEFDERIGGIDDRVVRLETPGGGGGSGGSDYFAGTDIGTGTTPANAGTGVGNTAAGSGAVIGDGLNNGTAIGSGAKSSAEGATAIGSNANASGSKSAAIGEGANASGSNSVALGAGSVATSDNTVSVGSATQQRTISNLADGVNASDAATKGQLDRAMGGMQGQMNELSRNAYSGIAAATALTMIPGVDPGKTLSFGIGGATFQGYQAVAFGGEARITQNLKMKAGVGLSSGGNTVGVGASYQW